ncbi:MAG: DUF92 domain-containing protein [Thermoplasmatota archaeon]
MGTLAGPWLLVLALALVGLALLAYSLRALNAAGSLAAVVVGLGVAWGAGLEALLLLVCFSALGVLATRVGSSTKRRRLVEEAGAGERGVANVLGNGLAPLAAALLVPWFPAWALGLKLAFATAIAAVTADTLASEIGVLSLKARTIVPPFARRKAGQNGAVSLLGQGAALAGSCAIAGLAVPFLGLPLAWAWVPALFGFLGCQLDSVLGATLERDEGRPGPLGKQQVNFLCGAVPALVVWLAFPR